MMITGAPQTASNPASGLEQALSLPEKRRRRRRRRRRSAATIDDGGRRKRSAILTSEKQSVRVPDEHSATNAITNNKRKKVRSSEQPGENQAKSKQANDNNNKKKEDKLSSRKQNHHQEARTLFAPVTNQLLTSHRQANATTPVSLSNAQQQQQQQQLQQQATTPVPIDHGQETQQFDLRAILLTICLPLISCLMFSLLLCYVWSYCKKLTRLKGERKHKSKVAKLKSQAKNGLKEISIISSDRHAKHKRAFDKRQLTIDMETNELSSDDQSISSGSITPKRANLLADKAKFVVAGKTASSGQKDKMKKTKTAGFIKYSLSYDFTRSILFVSIHEARELPPMDLCGTSDPYVKLFLTESLNSNGPASTCFKTKIHKRTLDPIFNESFQIQVAYPDLMKQQLCLQVFDYDRLSRHDEIGQVIIPFQSLDLSQAVEEKWQELDKAISLGQTSSRQDELGDICLSLRYVPTAGKLTVIVLEARKLKKMDLAGLSDPYVKLALLNEAGKRLKKKKTSIKKCTLNPHYNESFSFEIPFEQVQKVQLHVTVIDYDRIGTSEPIGRIILGCETTTGDTETRHWMDMLASPRRPIAQWHSLKQLSLDAMSS